MKLDATYDLVTVDPGLDGTAYACWREGKLLRTGCFRGGRGGEWTDRALRVFRGVRSILACVEIGGTIAIEEPFLDGTDARSKDLIKLVSMYGGCLAFTPPEVTFRSVPVREWKGTLPKGTCNARVTRWLLTQPNVDRFSLTHHELDAIGIGLFLLGYAFRETR